MVRWDLEGWDLEGCGLKGQGLQGQGLQGLPQEGGRSSQGLRPCLEPFSMQAARADPIL